MSTPLVILDSHGVSVWQSYADAIRACIDVLSRPEFAVTGAPADIRDQLSQIDFDLQAREASCHPDSESQDSLAYYLDLAESAVYDGTGLIADADGYQGVYIIADERFWEAAS